MEKKYVAKLIQRFERHYKRPINKIFCATSLLKKQLKGQESIENVQKLEQTSAELLRATKMMADYKRLSNDLYPHKPVYIDIVGFIKGIVVAAAPFILRNGIGCSYHMPPHEIFTVTEIEPLTMILCQLLSNACRFTSSENAIRIHMTYAGGIIDIAIRDNGVGMSKSVESEIFTPYYSYSPDGLAFAGNGLGLPLAKQCADFLGGELKVSTCEAGGSCFTLRLPICCSKIDTLLRPLVPKSAIKILMADTVRIFDSERIEGGNEKDE